MPNCRTCSPWCRRCHKKADYKFPVECPHCGWYNPYERETCKKCGAPVVHDEQKAVDHLERGSEEGVLLLFAVRAAAVQ